LHILRILSLAEDLKDLVDVLLELAHDVLLRPHCLLNQLLDLRLLGLLHAYSRMSQQGSNLSFVFTCCDILFMFAHFLKILIISNFQII